MPFDSFFAYGHDDIQDMLNVFYIRISRHLVEFGTEYDRGLNLWVWLLRYTPLHNIEQVAEQ